MRPSFPGLIIHLSVYTVIGLISLPSANALPFKANPSSFESYLNSRTWKKGTTLVFQDLADCKWYSNSQGDWYNCNEGFVTISNAQGTKVCELSSHDLGYPGSGHKSPYSIQHARSSTGYKIYYGTKNCRWRN